MYMLGTKHWESSVLPFIWSQHWGQLYSECSCFRAGPRERRTKVPGPRTQHAYGLCGSGDACSFWHWHSPATLFIGKSNNICGCRFPNLWNKEREPENAELTLQNSMKCNPVPWNVLYCETVLRNSEDPGKTLGSGDRLLWLPSWHYAYELCDPGKMPMSPCVSVFSSVTWR